MSYYRASTRTATPPPTLIAQWGASFQSSPKAAYIRFDGKYDAARPVQTSADIASRAPCGLSLAKDIEEICDLVGIACTRFCREAVGDPRFYHDLKFGGRRPGHDTRVRVLMHINQVAIDHSRRCKAKAAVAALAGGR